MKVQIAKVTTRVRRHKASGGTTLDKAHARGFVDGFLVPATKARDGIARVSTMSASTPTPFSAVLHPDILKVLDADGEPE